MSHEAEPRPSSKFEPVHGVHYLVDVYALMGVARDADPKAITTAFRARIREYHPDRYQGLAPEMQTRAARTTSLLNSAVSVLQDPELRSKYDERLNEWKGPLSNDGTPMMSIRDFMNYHETGTEAESRIDGLLDQIRQMSGYDPKFFEEVEREYRATKKPSSILTRMYKDLLFKKQVALKIEEDMRREALGLDIVNFNSPPIGYLEDANAALTRRRDSIGAEVETTLKALQSGEIKMLGVGTEEVTQALATNTEETIARYQQQALEDFDRRSGTVRLLADQQQSMIEQRLDLVRGVYRPEQKQLFARLAICMEIGDTKKWFAFHQTGPENLDYDNSLSEEEMQGFEDEAKATEVIKRGYNVMFVGHEEGIPAPETLTRAVQMHYYDRDQQRKREARKVRKSMMTRGEFLQAIDESHPTNPQ